MRFMWIPDYGMGHKHRDSGFLGRDAYDVFIDPVDMDEAHEHEHEHHASVGMKMVHSVLETPPATWAQYKGKEGDHWKIVEMEENELQTAHAAMKAGTKTEKSVVRELSHVAAASIAAINAIIGK